MIKSLEELKNEQWEKFKEENEPKGQAEFYYKDNCEYWKDGFDAAINAVSGKAISKKEIVDIITEWKHFWMNQTKNNQQDYENYFRRAAGVDANMKYDLAKRICEAVKESRGLK